ncbi:hypothetical protein PINS_up006341 [Pythium insidiosum]|nr:hypothetical protein PINS_up006341 [Pythium insidiosum]
MAANPFARFSLHATQAPAPAEAPRAASTATKNEGTSIASASPRKRIKREHASFNGEDSHQNQDKPPTSAQLVDDKAGVMPPPREEDARVALLQALVEARDSGPPAPIDRFGTQACVAPGVSPDSAAARFQILVAALLSSQTQDGVTHAAMQRLHTQLHDASGGAEDTLGLSIACVRRATTERIEELLNPVGFYRRKAAHMKQIAETLHASYHDDIPRSLDDLEALPGIGPKIARVILLLAWGDDSAGLIVDTHVHRLAQRLGWVCTTAEKPIKTAEDTRVALEEWVPREYWRGFSRHVVGFGQTTCVAVYPHCVDCPLAPQCPSAYKCVPPPRKPRKTAAQTRTKATTPAHAEDQERR